ncbi:MAG TPA: ATP-binding protein [Thermoanaerobaculia bacterium]
MSGFVFGSPDLLALESDPELQVALVSVGIGALIAAVAILLIHRAQQKRAQERLERQLKFERLVSDLSASLIDVEYSRADAEVTHALKRVLEAMDLDCCSLFVVTPGEHRPRTTHHAEAAGVGAPEIVWHERLPTLVEELRRGNTIAIEDVAHDSSAAASEARLRNRAVKSLLMIPVSQTDSVVRGISFEATRRNQPWPADIVSRLRLVGQILFSAVTSKRAEARLQASEEKYREVVNSQTELICRFLPDTTLTFVNEAYCRYFAQAREELLGRPFLELIPDGPRETVRRHVESLVESPRVVIHEHEVLCADGSIGWQQWVNHAVRGRDGRVVEFQAIGRDITDRKRAEEADRRLASAARLTTLGELAASIAHEVNQPLGAILSNAEAAEMLLETGQLDAVKTILSDIHREDLRASDVIKRVRSLLQHRPLKLQSLDVNDLAREIARFVEPDARRRGIELEMDLGTDLHPVQGDSVQLQQLLLNLVLNGMDAMAETPVRARKLTISTRGNENGLLEIAVIDRGHGIAADLLPRLFQSFVTTRESGMGLGLSLSRSIAESHGGKIRAENNPDQGATFRLVLPAEEAVMSGSARPRRAS